MAILLLQVLVLFLCNSSKWGKLRKRCELWPHPFLEWREAWKALSQGSLFLVRTLLSRTGCTKEKCAVTNPTMALGLTATKRMSAQEGGSNRNSPGTWPF